MAGTERRDPTIGRSQPRDWWPVGLLWLHVACCMWLEEGWCATCSGRQLSLSSLSRLFRAGGRFKIDACPPVVRYNT